MFLSTFYYDCMPTAKKILAVASVLFLCTIFLLGDLIFVRHKSEIKSKATEILGYTSQNTILEDGSGGAFTSPVTPPGVLGASTPTSTTWRDIPSDVVISGKVGIGTTDTSFVAGRSGLRIEKSVATLRLQSSLGGLTGVEIYADNNGLNFENMNSGRNFIFKTGNVSIGTTDLGRLLEVRGVISSGTTASDYLPGGFNWNYTHLLNGTDNTSIGFHDSGASVSSIRYNNAGFTIGGDDGWGVKNVTMPGTLSIGNTPIKVYGLTSGGHQWDMYLNGNNLRFSDNSGAGGQVAVDTGATFGGNVSVAGDANATRLCIASDCRSVWPSGGGGAVPGGANGNVQFNNSGTFGGTSNLSWDNPNSKLSINGVGLFSDFIYAHNGTNFALRSGEIYGQSGLFSCCANMRFTTTANRPFEWSMDNNIKMTLAGAGRLHVHNTDTTNYSALALTSSNPSTWIAFSDGGTTMPPIQIGSIGNDFTIQTGPTQPGGGLLTRLTVTTDGNTTVAGNLKVGPFYFDGNDDAWLRLRDGDNGANYKDLAVGNFYTEGQYWANNSICLGGVCRTSWPTTESRFGGYYKYTINDDGTNFTCVEPNPQTGSCSCPSGYTDHEVTQYFSNPGHRPHLCQK